MDSKQEQRLKRLRLNRHRHWDVVEGYYHVATLYGLEVSAGGWADDKKWLSEAELLAAEERASKRILETVVDKEEQTGWAPYQCGGCRWMAALNGNWGICCCPESPHDGRIIFEHGGCEQHHVYREKVNKEGIK